MSIIADCRQLSSGTMAGLIRAARINYGYKCAEHYVIDKVQHRFVWYVEHCRPVAETWQDAWNAYVRNLHRVSGRFASSYQGETDYEYSGRRYAVRHHACDYGYNGDYFETGILKQLGCVFRVNGMADGYPPDDVIAAFPAYVPLTATFEWVDDPNGYRGKSIANWEYVYHPDFGKPEIIRSHHKGDKPTFCTPWECDWDRLDYDTDIKPYKGRELECA